VEPQIKLLRTKTKITPNLWRMYHQKASIKASGSSLMRMRKGEGQLPSPDTKVPIPVYLYLLTSEAERNKCRIDDWSEDLVVPEAQIWGISCCHDVIRYRGLEEAPDTPVLCELSRDLKRQLRKGIVGFLWVTSLGLTDIIADVVRLSVCLLVPLFAGSTGK